MSCQGLAPANGAAVRSAPQGGVRALRAAGWRLRRTRLGRWAVRRGRRLLQPFRGWLHGRRLRRPDPSYAQEWAHVRGLLARIRRLDGGCAVDIGAGDGATDSCTLPLFRDYHWRGLALESDPRRHRLLRRGYRRFPTVRVELARVTPDDVAARLFACDIAGDFDFLNLDIDSFDLAVAAALLERFRPAVIDMEVNEKIPPPIRFAVCYAPDHRWDESHFYGCSLCAAVDVLGERGYRLEGLEYNNAFFVRDDIARTHGVAEITPEQAYREGYAERAGRARLFPWNADVDGLLDCAPAEALAGVAAYFHDRAGRFHLGLEPLDARAAGAVGARF